MTGPYSNRLRDVLRCLCLGLLLAYFMLPLKVTAPNERSRLYLTVALFERHSFNIDAERIRYGRTFDEAAFAGHFYSDKAPGSSLVALPAYALLRATRGSSVVTVEQLLLLGRYGVMLPIGLLGFFALKRLALTLGIRPNIAEVLAWASLIATPAFHYSAAFFGHHLVAVYWLFALLVLQEAPASRRNGTWVRAAAVGVLLSLVQLTEYQAVLGTVPLLLYAFYCYRRAWARQALAIGLGALPGAVFFAYYHNACFGGPFELSYHHLLNPALAAVHGQGIGGVLWPTVAGLGNSLFSLHRGLFATSPLLLLFPLGIYGMWRRGFVALAWLSTVLAATFILFMSASLTWEAGWGYGPRLLLPVVPILALLVAFGAEYFARKQWFWTVLGSLFLASLLSVQIVTAFFPEPPVEFKNPILDAVVPLARAHLLPLNLGSRWFGLAGYASLLPLMALLLWPIAQFCRAAVEATQSRRFLWGLPIASFILAIVVTVSGPSVGPEQQQGFVRFVGSLENK